VVLHGGHVPARSEGIGKGSTFTVMLPISLAMQTNGSREHPASPRSEPATFEELSLEGLKVLVVDDERDSREMIAQLLSERKAQIIQAPDANSGIELLKAHRPHLILSDIGMPGKDGYEFIREVRALTPEQGGRTTAIALTAFARSEDRARAMLAGYQLHMPKPVEAHELIVTVASLADKRGDVR
jgi:CheY-like chemotaxis protein